MANTDVPDPGREQLVPSGTPAPTPCLGARRALKIFLVFVGAQFVAGVFVGVGVALATVGASPGGKDAIAATQNLQPLVAALAGVIGLPIGGFVAMHMTKRSLPGPLGSGSLPSIGWLRPSGAHLMSAAVLGAGLALSCIFVLERAFPAPSTHVLGPLASAAMRGGWLRIAWALLVMLAPPIEEFMFRGVLFSGLSRSWGTIWSGVLVTIAFVALHATEVWGYWPDLLSIAMLAVAVLLLRIKTHSLAPAVACHGAYNLVVLLAVYSGMA